MVKIAELEAFCTELVRQIEEWRKLDRDGKLIANKLEGSLVRSSKSIKKSI